MYCYNYLPHIVSVAINSSAPEFVRLGVLLLLFTYFRSLSSNIVTSGCRGEALLFFVALSLIISPPLACRVAGAPWGSVYYIEHSYSLYPFFAAAFYIGLLELTPLGLSNFKCTYLISLIFCATKCGRSRLEIFLMLGPPGISWKTANHLTTRIYFSMTTLIDMLVDDSTDWYAFKMFLIHKSRKMQLIYGKNSFLNHTENRRILTPSLVLIK